MEVLYGRSLEHHTESSPVRKAQLRSEVPEKCGQRLQGLVGGLTRSAEKSPFDVLSSFP